MKQGRRAGLGFTLIEITLALGLAAFCLLAIFGLIPVGLNSNQNAISQTAAAGIATGIIADLRATPTTGTPPFTSPRYQIPVPVAGAGVATHTIFLQLDGSPAGATAAAALDNDAVVTQNPAYRAMIVFTPPPSTGLRNATMVRLLITWPALADRQAIPVPGASPPAPPQTPVNYSGSYEIMSALDRN